MTTYYSLDEVKKKYFSNMEECHKCGGMHPKKEMHYCHQCFEYFCLHCWVKGHKFAHAWRPG